MTDIRTVKASEAEDFLRLLCRAFSLDFNRAYDVFFTEPFFDLNRKWALFEGPEMISILTTTPLRFGWGNAVGVAGVATSPERQREGHATRLLQRVCRESERRDEGPALLFARETELYEANGFEPLDRVIRAPVLVCPETDSASVGSPYIRERYTEWSEAHPDRLRRDDQRWSYWNWHYRIASEYAGGYICHEPGVLREAVFEGVHPAMPLPADTDFLGTTLVADTLEIPLGEPVVDLYLMGRNIPGVPQMFMTDQF